MPKPHTEKVTSSRLKELSETFGVTIILDYENESDEALSGCTYSWEPGDKILRIVAPALAVEDKPLLMEIIRRVHEQNGLIWKSTKNQILESYREYIANNNDANTLEFFRKIIDRDDYNALKMSLYLRSEKAKGNNITVYKNDIRERYGDRGANIANLCTAGYFEQEFVPLYNTLSKEEFNEYYELAVGEKARALFVHAGINIEEAFNDMLQKALTYHMKDFRIHGIGNLNVSIIKDFFASRTVDANDNFVAQKHDERLKPPAIEYIVTITRQ